MHCLFHIKILICWNGTRAIRNFSRSMANRREAQCQGGIHLEAVSGIISILNQQAQAFSGLAAFFCYIGAACWSRRFGLPANKRQTCWEISQLVTTFFPALVEIWAYKTSRSDDKYSEQDFCIDLYCAGYLLHDMKLFLSYTLSWVTEFKLSPILGW